MKQETIYTIEYPNGERRSLIALNQNYRYRDEFGGNHKITKQTACLLVDAFDSLCRDNLAMMMEIGVGLPLLRTTCAL